LGLDGLDRFLQMNRAGGGDYTRDRRGWLGAATIDDIMIEIDSRRKPAP